MSLSKGKASGVDASGMDEENGQTTIEYVLVLLIAALVIFFALQTSAIEEVVGDAWGIIANKMVEAFEAVIP